MFKRIVILFFAALAAAFAQGVQSSTASHLRFGSSLPATCRPSTGDIFFRTATSIGPYFCSATNTWSQMGAFGGSAAFSGITGGTNTTAAMVVGTGASLGVSGSGTINATSLGGTAAASYALGAASSTANGIARYSGTGGKTLLNSGCTINDSGNLSCTGTVAGGSAGGTTGALDLSGSTSGTVTITTAAVAGTWTLQLPANDGNSGQFLQTDGNGVATWSDSAGISNYHTSTTGTGIGPTAFTPASTDTLLVYDSTASTGETLMTIRMGPGQDDSDYLLEFRNADGTQISSGTGFRYSAGNGIFARMAQFIAEANNTYAELSNLGVRLNGSAHGVRWGSSQPYNGVDTGLYRIAAGVVGVGSGTTNTTTGRIALDNSTPTAATDACTAKSLWADANYVYVCTASGAIKRSAIATW